jgi:hypothetical protein
MAPDSDSLRLTPILGLFLLFTAMLAGLYLIAGRVGFVGTHLTEIYAVLFLVIPHLWSRRTGFPIPDFGALPRGLLWGVGVTVVVCALFALGYDLYFRALCAGDLPVWNLGRDCRALHEFRFPGWQATGHLFLIHAIAVALPEEYFYRGFLQPLILRAPTLAAMSSTRRLAIAVVLQAICFAVGHALVDFNFMRAAVFFPGLLFGALAAGSGGLWAPILCHAAANVLSETLEAGYFG